MLGVIIIIILSWSLLFFIEKENLSVLGFTPLRKRGLQFIIGLGFISILRSIFIFVDTQVLSISWEMEQVVRYDVIFNSLWYHFISALTEDLVFRGVLLYILIKRIGLQKGILISAIAFGTYHWFSYGLIGSSAILLIYVLLTTGFVGYVWAYTFAKTKSILMPLGFHFGWNFITTLFYDRQPYGNLVYNAATKVELSEPSSTVYSLLIGLLPPLLTFIFVRKLVER